MTKKCLTKLTINGGGGGASNLYGCKCNAMLRRNFFWRKLSCLKD